MRRHVLETTMLSKFKTLTLVALASATLSTAALAAPVIDLRVGPPPPRVEVMPAARPGYVWVPGYWDWRGGRHYWVAGNWVRERRGYVYAPPAWVEEGGHWRLHRGAWGRGDRDGDGVPNRFDRHPDNPRRP
jgi:YXWGXW repeat-containing protein